MLYDETTSEETSYDEATSEETTYNKIEIYDDKNGYIKIDKGEILSSDVVIADIDISKILHGNFVMYKRLTRDNMVFELLKSDKITIENEFSIVYEQFLVISNADNHKVIQITEHDFTNLGYHSDCKEMLYVDVDFDGKNDLLIYEGCYGSDGKVCYSCFLQTDSGFTNSNEFSLIPNPCIDFKNKEIRGSWRNWAASHSWAKYKFVDGVFVEDKVLTENPIKKEDDTSDSDENKYLWAYDIDGVEIARGDKNTKEEIDNLIGNGNNEWRLKTDDFVPLWEYEE